MDASSGNSHVHSPRASQFSAVVALAAVLCAAAAGRWWGASEQLGNGAPSGYLPAQPPPARAESWSGGGSAAPPVAVSRPSPAPMHDTDVRPAEWQLTDSLRSLAGDLAAVTEPVATDDAMPAMTPAPPREPSATIAAELPRPATEPAANERNASGPPAPLEGRQVTLPLTPASAVPGVVKSEDGAVSIAVREAPLHAVLSLLAQQQGLSIVASSQLNQPITVTLQPTTLDTALDALLAVANCTWTRRQDVIYVTPVSAESTTSPFFQGRQVQVFTLNYASAEDVEKVVTGLLSPVGKVFSRQVDSTDRRRTVEQLVVEDMPPFLERAAQYIAQADQMPRQVMVEAHILQVRLGKDKEHGVNFDGLARLSGARMQLWNKGFASDTGPGMVFTVDGTDFNGLIDCLTTTTDAKTLASPKVFALNGQEARIQIGQRLGYFITTTTQTSTLQDVQFLEVGVVLHVTPSITDDGQVLMQVRPKVSSGAINPDTTLPEEETTEVETSIVVPDGQGIIIGGLIQETDIDRQSKLSYLGDLWLVGRLFQRRTVDKERNEVIVALLPRIVPCGACTGPEACVEWERSASPLMMPHLDSAPRPWEPQLPDASHRPMRHYHGAAGAPPTLDAAETMPLEGPGEGAAPDLAIEMLPAPEPEVDDEIPASLPVEDLPVIGGPNAAPSAPWSPPR